MGCTSFRCAWPTARSRSASRLELADATFDDDEPDHHSSSCPVLDLKMINRSRSTIVVKRVDVHVEAVWKVPKKRLYSKVVIWGHLSWSASYDLAIPERAPPFILSQPVSHVVKPDKAERFRIVFRPAFGGDAVFSMHTKVIHGSENSEETRDELLCAIRDFNEYGGWDTDEQRTCVQLAGEIRQRKGHMSKRLLELLEEMQAGGR